VPSSSALLFLSENKVKHESPKSLMAFGNPSYMLKDSSNGKKSKTHVEILRELYLDQGFDFSPLPYTEREILEISSYFPDDRKDIYLKDEAREEIFKEAPLQDYQIIHFACHGFLAEEFPFRSALILALDDDPQEDGFLQVRELYNLRLKADLVVLSACQTGKGKLERGEGILGLPRIFFYAGAKSVILTLWRINDESTATFMNSLYCYLSKGNDKAQALRLAKLEMINSKFSHPFYWAAFVLNGDSNSKLNFR
jgi:CHAT domain-containing protein